MNKCFQFGGVCGCISCGCNRKDCDSSCASGCSTCSFRQESCMFPINNPSRYKGSYRRSEQTAERYHIEKQTNACIRSIMT